VLEALKKRTLEYQADANEHAKDYMYKQLESIDELRKRISDMLITIDSYSEHQKMPMLAAILGEQDWMAQKCARSYFPLKAMLRNTSLEEKSISKTRISPAIFSTAGIKTNENLPANKTGIRTTKQGVTSH